MTTMRLDASQAPGHSIDRSRPVGVSVDGAPYEALSGDTVASALVAAGRLDCGTSMYGDRPRGILSAGVEEPNALLTVAARSADQVDESMLPATVVEATDGLSATYLRGLGVLDPRTDRAVYDHKHVHTDVLVIGAGPAGLAAARQGAASGAHVILMDDQPQPGGSLLSGRHEEIDGEPAVAWAASAAAAIESSAEATYLRRTTAIGSYDANYVVAVQQRTDHLPVRERRGVSRQRIWHVRAAQVILATGAHERPLVFEDNDRPGVMLAGAVRSYLNRYAAAAGREVVIATTNDAPYALAHDLVESGVRVAAIVDSREEASAAAAAAQEAGLDVRLGSAVVGTEGEATAGRVSAVLLRSLDAKANPVGETQRVAADLLAVSGGHSPVTHLHSQRQGTLRWDAELAGFVPADAVSGQQVVGSASGATCLATVLEQGAMAGREAAVAVGLPTDLTVPRAARTPASTVRPVWLVEGSAPGDYSRHFVDLQRDQSVADVLRATGAGMRSVEHIKRYTSIGTANDQGKTSGVNAIAVTGALLSGDASSVDPGSLGTTGFRAPYTPVSFVALAGRRRGELFDPARVTSIQPWHEARGALFEDVGQWKRPWYFPQAGEDMDAAVARECAAVRDSVGFMDATTLGKIEIRGKDAGEFLNRVYTNGFAKLRVGMGRYGVMCSADGMVFDDGVTLRLADDRFLMTTTTGGAAKVLDWLEEWLQTEWPEFDVTCTSVTEQYSTVAVVGPRSRDVVAAVAPDLDVSNESFAFMEFRETTLANGVPARIARISFSGELAFEISVDAFYGLSLWEAVAQAGEPHGITPYGTETMHVLRAEKGFIIVGQDTDGTVTPQDAGMDWVVSKLKDFVGNRSFSRADTARPDRKHLVGIVPVDGESFVPEGAQIIAEDATVEPSVAPVPMQGHVTSAYVSPALGTPFALALIDSGRDREGQQVHAFHEGRRTPVRITSPILLDPEGKRRDG